MKTKKWIRIVVAGTMLTSLTLPMGIDSRVVEAAAKPQMMSYEFLPNGYVVIICNHRLIHAALREMPLEDQTIPIEFLYQDERYETRLTNYGIRTFEVLEGGKYIKFTMSDGNTHIVSLNAARRVNLRVNESRTIPFVYRHQSIRCAVKRYAVLESEVIGDGDEIIFYLSDGSQQVKRLETPIMEGESRDVEIFCGKQRLVHRVSRPTQVENEYEMHQKSEIHQRDLSPGLDVRLIVQEEQTGEAASLQNDDPVRRHLAHEIVAKMNEERTKRGLSPFTLDRKMTKTARSEVREINSESSLSNDPGRNRVKGKTVEKIIENSIRKRASYQNMFNPLFTKVGIAYHQGKCVMMFK